MPRRLNKRAYAASIKNAVLEESLIDAIALKRIRVQLDELPHSNQDLNNLLFL
jgi:hypothetical protein